MYFKRSMAELLAAMASYALVLTASLAALRGDTVTNQAARAAITLSPMLPGFAMCWVILRHMRRQDELAVRASFEAVGFAFAATALVTFSYGFLENIGLPRLSMFVVWPLMSTFWVVGSAISAWRYR